MFSKARRESMEILLENVSINPGRTWKSFGALYFQGILQFLHFARCMYVVIAAMVVCHGFYNAYQKMMTEDVSTRHENKAVDKLRYPSLTFCYKYKHGSKQVFDNYLPRFYEQAKTNGMFLNNLAAPKRKSVVY